MARAIFSMVVTFWYSIFYRMFKTLYNTHCGGGTIACLPINLEVVVNRCRRLIPSRC